MIAASNNIHPKKNYNIENYHIESKKHSFLLSKNILSVLRQGSISILSGKKKKTKNVNLKTETKQTNKKIEPKLFLLRIF
jgi:hypothetical protein